MKMIVISKTFYSDIFFLYSWYFVLLLHSYFIQNFGVEGISSQDHVCAKGWNLYQTKCHKWFHVAMSQYSAQLTCQSFGAHLVKITDADTNNYIGRKAQEYFGKDNTYWIGLIGSSSIISSPKVNTTNSFMLTQQQPFPVSLEYQYQWTDSEPNPEYAGFWAIKQPDNLNTESTCVYATKTITTTTTAYKAYSNSYTMPSLSSPLLNYSRTLRSKNDESIGSRHSSNHILNNNNNNYLYDNNINIKEDTDGEIRYNPIFFLPQFEWVNGHCDALKPFVCQLPSCLKGQFQCANTKCIQMAWKCDKEDNCGDNSDEYDCPDQYSYYLEGTSGQIQSPKFPSNYPPNIVCRWKLESPVGSVIELLFNRFETEESFDIVDIRGGGNTRSTSIRIVTLSGKGNTTNMLHGHPSLYPFSTSNNNLVASKTDLVPTLSFLSPNHFMIIQFTADSTNQFKGFSAKWTAKTDTKNCGSQLFVRESTNVIMSPNYPNSAPPGMECTYHLKTKPGSIITLEIQSISLLLGDMFLVRDDPDDSNIMLFSYIPLRKNDLDLRDKELGDSTNQPVIITSTTNHITLFFFSNLYSRLGDAPGTIGLRSKRNFRINYKSGCKKRIVSKFGVLSSPGFGHTDYPVNLECEWEIISSDFNPISVIIHSIEIRKDGDYLEINDGNTRNLSSIEESIPGEKEILNRIFKRSVTSPQRFRSETGKFKIIFHSNEYGTTKGWNMTFSIDCPPLLIPKNVRVIEESLGNGYGAFKKLECQTNFQFTKAIIDSFFTIRCLKGGVWDKPYVPTCQPKYCGPVPLIDNGYVVQADKVTFEGTAIYECFPGFHFPNMVARQVITCNNEGWTQLPVCTTTTCSQFQSVLNGEVNVLRGDGTSYGTILEFSCLPGHELVGPNRSSCSSQGTWTDINPECQPIKCRSLPSITNGQYTVPDLKWLFYNETLEIECFKGYQSKLGRFIKCLANGTVSDIPVCQDIDECLRETEIGSNMCHEEGTRCNNTQGSYECTCLPGYRPKLECSNNLMALGMESGAIDDTDILFSNEDSALNKSFVRLNSFQAWCGTTLKPLEDWVQIELPEPRIITKLKIQDGPRIDGTTGYVKLFRIQYAKTLDSDVIDIVDKKGQIIKFRGISIVDNDKSSGTWVDLPIAIEAQLILVLVENFDFAPCMRFELYGCQRTSCVDIDECKEDPDICNPLCKNVLGGYRCECLPGYVLFTKNGTMSNFLPKGETGFLRTDTLRINHTCLRVLCPSLKHPENGIMITNVTNGLFYFTETVEFQCDLGFKHSGPKYLKCLANGAWDFQPPTCEAVKCKGLRTDIETVGIIAMPDSNEISYGHNVSLRCVKSLDFENTKYSDSYLRTLTRHDTGTAFSTYRQCVFDPTILTESSFSGLLQQQSPSITISSVSNPKRGRVIRRDVNSGDLEVWQTNSNDAKIGWPESINVEESTVDDYYWLSGIAPHCPVVNCGYPLSIPGAIYDFGNYSSTLVGSNFRFKCKKPYKISGTGYFKTTKVFCEENGSWNFGTLLCIGPICEDPGTPADAYQHVTSYEEGQTVNFTCSRPGFSTTFSSLNDNNHDILRCTVNTACSRMSDLGLTSGNILDSAIRVSSSLPGYDSNYVRLNSPKAWCGNDYNPTIRIDLTPPPSIDTNEEALTSQNNNESPAVIITGLRVKGYIDSSVMGQITAFRFNYSVEGAIRNSAKTTATTNYNYQMYPQTFNLSNVYPIGYAQIFILNPPVLTRSIIIEAIDFKELPCLKIEILGCNRNNRNFYRKLRRPRSTNSTNLQEEDFKNLSSSPSASELFEDAHVGWNKPAPICQDIEPPVFVNCPTEPIVVPDIVGDSLMRTINFAKPKAIDNYGVVGYLESPPFIESPFFMNTPELNITYTAFDHTGNQATCMIRFIINDNVPPILVCPLSYTREYEDPVDSLNITFTADKYGVTDDYLVRRHESMTPSSKTHPPTGQDRLSAPKVGLNIQFEPTFAVIPAKHFQTVKLSVTDSFNNSVSCQYHVSIQAQKCSFWSMPDIMNGVKECQYYYDQENTTQTTVGQRKSKCVYTCKEGYRFSTENTVQKEYICDYRLDWLPAPYVPDCVKPDNKLADYHVILNVLYHPSPANSDQSAIDLSSSAALVIPECLVSYTKAIESQLPMIAANLTNICSLGNLRVFAHFNNATFTTDKENAAVYGEFDLKLSTSNDVFVLLNRCTSTLSLLMSHSEATLSALMNITRGILEQYGKFNEFEITNPCPAIEAPPNYEPKVRQVYRCPAGKIIVYRNTIPYCMPCSPGTFQADNQTCKPCFTGSYQNLFSKFECLKCPVNTFTLHPMSKSSTDCLPVCANGSYSPTGLVPCQSCPYNTYSAISVDHGIRSCITCPESHFTVQTGSISLNDCKKPCPPGHFSPTGLEVCVSCPINHYQPKSGQNFCHECPDDTSTRVNASTSMDICEKVVCGGDKCQNGGLCKVLYHKEVCVCPSGFLGSTCEINIDECATTPCQNGGTCQDGSNGFICTCPKGFMGYRCEISPNNCKEGICSENSMCKNYPNNVECLCRRGFTGNFCNETIDSCQSRENPCLNGATCESGPLNRYNCKCAQGWTGKHCHINIDDCGEKPCLLGAKCTDLHMDFRCDCPPGFGGKRCEEKINLCAKPNTCYNGTCVDRLFNYECICPYGYTGDHCEMNINECQHNPCQNGGSCIDLVDNYECICQPGFTGLDCQHNIDECHLFSRKESDDDHNNNTKDKVPCLNGGICIDGINNYTCQCPDGIYGPRCEGNLDECIPNPCDRTGSLKCNDLIGDFNCTCKPGFSGDKCEINIDDCLTEPCLNGGTCRDQINDYNCKCDEGWTGKRCELMVEYCRNDTLCQNGGKCFNVFRDYFCACEPGYSGKQCTGSTDLCTGTPCLNGGTCVIEKNGNMNCLCPPSFYGDGCEKLKNPCENEPCKNGGSCREVILPPDSPHFVSPYEPSSFICDCLPGFQGANCQVNVDDCRIHPTVGTTLPSNPCPNFAKCVDGINSFTCQCPFNLTGPNCDKEIDINWDMYINGKTAKSGGYLLSPLYVKSPNLTIGMWVRFLDPNDKGKFFNLYETDSENHINPIRELLRVDHEGVWVNLEYGKEPYVIQFSGSAHSTKVEFKNGSPQTPNEARNIVNDGFWHHIMLVITNVPHARPKAQRDQGSSWISLDVILDGVRLTSIPDDTLIKMNSQPGGRSSLSKKTSVVEKEAFNRRKSYSYPEYLWITIGDINWTEDIIELTNNGHNNKGSDERLYRNTRQEPLLLKITDISSYLNKDLTKFRGYVSRVNLWERILDYNTEVPLQSIHCAKAPIIYDGLLGRWADYILLGNTEKLPTTCGISLCEEGRADPVLCDPLKLDKGKPKIVNCPTDIVITTDSRGIRVEWPKIMVEGGGAENKDVTYESSHLSGSYFALGRHMVTILSRDSSGNTDWCDFHVNVIPKSRSCQAQMDSMKQKMSVYGGGDKRNSATTMLECGKWGADSQYAFCEVKCANEFNSTFSLPIPKFFTCSAEGMWRPSIEPDNPQFPRCSGKRRAHKEVEIKTIFRTKGQCNSAGKEELERRITREIDILNEKWELFCNVAEDRNNNNRFDNDFHPDISRSYQGEGAKRFQKKTIKSAYECDKDMWVDILCQEKSTATTTTKALNRRQRKRSTFNGRKIFLDLVSLPKHRQTHLVVKRQTYTNQYVDGDNYTAEFHFKAINDPVKNRIDGTSRTLRDILMDHFYLSDGFDYQNSLPGVSVIKENVEIDIEPICFSNGQVLMTDICVNCSIGTFFDPKSQTCKLCSRDTYQDEEASYASCKPCPLINNKPGKTRGFGAISIKECKESCPPGYYFSPNSVSGTESLTTIDHVEEGCKPCGFGFYQSEWGSFSCVACPGSPYIPITQMSSLTPLHITDNRIQDTTTTLTISRPNTENNNELRFVYTTTISDNSTSMTECIEECNPGWEYNNRGICQKCGKGSYRRNVLDDRCQSCPKGYTTLELGSYSDTQCIIPICEPGTYLLTESNICKLCPLGTYQDKFLRQECHTCPIDHTTLKEGANHRNQCLSTNECETGVAKCVKNSTCINKPDGYECLCDNGFIGDGLVACNDTNECRMGIHDCHEFAECFDLPESFKCSCKAGYFGDGVFCKDSCDDYCLNNGICRKNEFHVQYCECIENFSGLICADKNKIRELKFIIGGISGTAILLVFTAFVIWMICVKNKSVKNYRAAHMKDKSLNGLPGMNGAGDGLNGDLYSKEDHLYYISRQPGGDNKSIKKKDHKSKGGASATLHPPPVNSSTSALMSSSFYNSFFDHNNNNNKGRIFLPLPPAETAQHNNNNNVYDSKPPQYNGAAYSAILSPSTRDQNMMLVPYQFPTNIYSSSGGVLIPPNTNNNLNNPLEGVYYPDIDPQQLTATFRRRPPPSFPPTNPNGAGYPQSQTIGYTATPLPKDDNFLIAPIPPSFNGGSNINHNKGIINNHQAPPYYITYPASTRSGYDYGPLHPVTNTPRGTPNNRGEDDNFYDIYTYQNHAYNPEESKNDNVTSFSARNQTDEYGRRIFPTKSQNSDIPNTLDIRL